MEVILKHLNWKFITLESLELIDKFFFLKIRCFHFWDTGRENDILSLIPNKEKFIMMSDGGAGGWMVSCPN